MRMRLTRAGVGQPVTSLVCQDLLLPRLTKPDGSTIKAPRTVQYPPNLAPSSADPIAMRDVVATRPASSETHLVKAGGMNCIVAEWYATVDGFVAVPVLAHFDALGPNERYFERMDQTDELDHNPTGEGGFVDTVGYSVVDGEIVLDDPTKFCPSLGYFQDLHPGVDGAAYIEGACRPITFDASGILEGQKYQQGGSTSQVLWWWDKRHWQKLELNVGNRSRVHRVTHGFYERRAWDGSESAPFRYSTQTGVVMPERPISNRIDKVELIDIDDLASIVDKTADLAAFGVPEDFRVYTTIAQVLYTRSQSGIVLQEGNPFSQGRGCIACTDTSTGWCVAIIGKIDQTGQPFTGCVTPNELAVGVKRFTNFDSLSPAGQVMDNYGPFLQINSYDSKRAAGWLIHSYLLYVGHRDNLEAALDEIATSGLVDAAAPTPALAARAGTEWPQGTDPGTFVADGYDDSTPPVQPVLPGGGGTATGGSSTGDMLVAGLTDIKRYSVNGREVERFDPNVILDAARKIDARESRRQGLDRTVFEVDDR